MKTTKNLVLKAAAICTTAFLIFTVISCQTNKEEYVYEDDDIIFADREEDNPAFVAPAITDDYLGDFDPILLKSTVALTKSGKKMKPKTLSKSYIVPRSNNLEIHFHQGPNKICVIFNKAERDKFKEAAELFLEQYDTKTIERHKPNKKNAYYRSRCSLWYGLTALTYGTGKNDYWTNCNIIDKHAYFMIHFIPSHNDNGKDVTPKFDLYFSPTQLRDFLELMDQEYLNSQVQELREKAYTYQSATSFVKAF